MSKNILMIFTDQMHKYALGCLSPFVKTPNLDRLASEGTLFTNAYSNNPVCTPFRGLLYSGRYSMDCGVQNNCDAISPNELCLPDELHALGYDTSFVGKLHLGDKGNCPVPRKFWAGHNHFIGYQCYNGFLKDVCFYDENQTEHRFEGHRTDVTAQLGIERLRELAAQGKPFMETIFFQAPHYPEQPSPEYEALYDGVEFPMPECFAPVQPYTPTQSPPSPRPFELCPDYQRYGNDIQMYLKLYYGMVSQIDANVGKILDELEKLGLADDTMILFSADHGDMQGSHGLVNKCLPFERSCGIPLIVKIPGMKQVPVVDTPVSAVDYYPTCMEIAGSSSRKTLPGKSLLPLISGEKTDHPAVFAENHLGKQDWFMLRNDTYKLVTNGTTGKPTDLYDMENDPTESRNLVEDAAYAEVVKAMSEQLAVITAGYDPSRKRRIV